MEIIDMIRYRFWWWIHRITYVKIEKLSVKLMRYREGGP